MQKTTTLEEGAQMTRRTPWLAGALALLICANAGTASAQTYRTIDGFGNNSSNPELGSTDSQLLRQLLPSDYADGISALAGSPTRPNARSISNDFFQPLTTHLSPRLQSGLPTPPRIRKTRSQNEAGFLPK